MWNGDPWFCCFILYIWWLGLLCSLMQQTILLQSHCHFLCRIHKKHAFLTCIHFLWHKYAFLTYMYLDAHSNTYGHKHTNVTNSTYIGTNLDSQTYSLNGFIHFSRRLICSNRCTPTFVHMQISTHTHSLRHTHTFSHIQMHTDTDAFTTHIRI